MYYIFIFKFSVSNKKLLIYTDSRGFLVNCFLCNKTPKDSYVRLLSKDYKVANYQLCKKTHTTIIDFLDYIDKINLNEYSYIILHLGIVDFSTRPLKQLDIVYNKKKYIAKKIFPHEEMNPQYYDELYENEKTFSLYDTKYLVNVILPKINEISKITKIIWLGLNKIDLEWNGTYSKNRPSNINNILLYQNEIINFLQKNDNNIKYINVDDIEEFDLKTHTVDNIHLSKSGFKLFYNLLKKELK